MAIQIPKIGMIRIENLRI